MGNVDYGSVTVETNMNREAPVYKLAWIEISLIKGTFGL